MSERLSQQAVDEIRLSIITSTIVQCALNGTKKPDVKHLRFHEPKLTAYELRDWNPPADSERHPWERGLRLEVDVGEIPPSVVRAVKHLKQRMRGEGDGTVTANIAEVKRLVLERERKNNRLWLPPGLR